MYLIYGGDHFNSGDFNNHNTTTTMPRLGASREGMHGCLAREDWVAPERVAYAPTEARPGYDSCAAHEYVDEPTTLAAKVRVLAGLLRQSRQCVAYTGAGISTASGINDYASVAAQSVAGIDAHSQSAISPMCAQPTLAHRVLTGLYTAGYLKRWVQQNHDGLPQKAGYPQHALNEIHGAWFDPSNPVVKMSGALRDDLFADLLKWEQQTDLCLAIGTSLAGMNADRIASTVANKVAAGRSGALGTVIISLQQTKMDETSSLRIFARIDAVMELLARELDITPPTPPSFLRQSTSSALTDQEEEEQHWINYGSDGSKLREGQAPRLLDMSEGQIVRIVSGPYAGDEGEVLGRSRHGHYHIRFLHAIKKKTLRFPDPFGVGGNSKGDTWLAPMTHTLGAWMVQEAEQGLLSHFPIESVDEAEALAAESEHEIFARQEVAALRGGAALEAAAPQGGGRSAADSRTADRRESSRGLPDWVLAGFLEDARSKEQ